MKWILTKKLFIVRLLSIWFDVHHFYISFSGILLARVKKPLKEHVQSAVGLTQNFQPNAWTQLSSFLKTSHSVFLNGQTRTFNRYFCSSWENPVCHINVSHDYFIFHGGKILNAFFFFFPLFSLSFFFFKLKVGILHWCAKCLCQ